MLPDRQLFVGNMNSHDMNTSPLSSLLMTQKSSFKWDKTSVCFPRAGLCDRDISFSGGSDRYFNSAVRRADDTSHV